MAPSIRFSFDQTDLDYRVYAEMVEHESRLRPNLMIAGRDEFYAHSEQTYGSRTLGLLDYFRAGMQVSDAVRQITDWHFRSERKITRFLDFAAGYGRSTRFLQAELGHQRVWACDPSPESMRFLEEQLGVQTIPCGNTPQDFKPGMQFDCIFVSSLFCHLPETTFSRWLWKLYSLLEPGGLLILSVQGEAMLPNGTVMPRSGIAFQPLNESPLFDSGEYGSAVVTDHFVQTTIAAVTGTNVHQRIAQGLCYQQDVYLVPKGAMKAGPVPFRYSPVGCVDACRWTEPEQMKLTGWAFDTTVDERITHVEAYYNGVVRCASERNHSRPDVAASLGQPKRAEAVHSGWDCLLDLKGEKIRPDQDWILVKAISSTGKESVLLLDHPANLSEFESLQGWAYADREDGQAIPEILRFIDYPPNGRLQTADPVLSGWIAARQREILEDVHLEGRFGPLPFSAAERPDVAYYFPGFIGLGFRFALPPQYLNVNNPKLRFVTSSGAVLATLDIMVEDSAKEAANAVSAARKGKRAWCLAHVTGVGGKENCLNFTGLPEKQIQWMGASDDEDGQVRGAVAQALALAEYGGRVLVVGAGLQQVFNEKIVFLDPTDSPSTDVIARNVPLPFLNALFDAVVYARRLSADAEPSAMTQELLRILKPEGVILSDPSFLEVGSSDAGVLTRFERAELEKQLVAMR